MKVLDKVIELERLQMSTAIAIDSIESVSSKSGDYLVCILSQYTKAPTFSVFDINNALNFINFIVSCGNVTAVNQDSFTGDVEDARQALNNYLNSEV